MKRSIFLFFLLFVAVMPTLAEQYVLGVVPQQSPFKLLKVWQPIADYLTKSTGYTIVFKTEKSIAEFEQVLYAGGYDVAYMNPYHYVVANRQQGYVAAVRAEKELVGILVAREGDLQALLASKQTRFLFPSPNAFAATLLTKYELLTRYGYDVDAQNRFLYVNSHDSVYKGVARGIGDLGGGIERTLANMQDADARRQLRIVYRTESYPSHPIALKPTLPSDLRDKLISAFTTMPPELLEPLGAGRLMDVGDAEYDAVCDLAKRLKLIRGE